MSTEKTTLLEIAKKMKAKQNMNGTAYEIRIPAPEKEFAKDNGAKWNQTKKCYEIFTDSIDTHALSHLLVTSEYWTQLKHNIPFDYKNEFKDAGVVTVKIDDKWQDFVLVNEKYSELITALTEAELL
jgi:hypothetical protein